MIIWENHVSARKELHEPVAAQAKSSPHCRKWSLKLTCAYKRSHVHWLISRDAWRSFHLSGEAVTSSPRGNKKEEQEEQERIQHGMRKMDGVSRLRMWLLWAWNTGGGNSEDDLQTSPRTQLSIIPLQPWKRFSEGSWGGSGLPAVCLLWGNLCAMFRLLEHER